jgi:tRNA threonylcarbamoyladenosine biosynthesis protein TsaB
MAEPLILAVETSSRIGSVALARGPALLAETAFSAPLQHSAEVFPAIEQLLDRFGHSPGDLAQVHVATGPGSFTGLRIAVTIAKTMYLASRTDIVAVDSLDVIAANTAGASPRSLSEDAGSAGIDRLAVVLDAKRGEFYAAVYERVVRSREAAPADETGYEIPAPGGRIWRKIVPDCLITAEDLMARCADAPVLGVIGDGLLYHRERFAARGVHILGQEYWSPRASKVHQLGWQKAHAGRFDDALTLTPFYLRGPHVTIKQRP